MMANLLQPPVTAVMASRRSAASSLDFFPTPPWATRALIEELLFPEGLMAFNFRKELYPEMVWDPACGAGHMAIPLAEYFEEVLATDVHDWGFGDVRNLDFTMVARDTLKRRPAWVIGNPPFVLAERFVDRALDIAVEGVAMLLRLNWLEGGERYELIFGSDRRPTFVCPFAERVPMIEGVYDPEASSATAYAWYIWDRYSMPSAGRTQLIHIPPGMAAKYFRPEDEMLATRGEAERRRKLKAQAAEAA
jgi:hypothetical protein